MRQSLTSLITIWRILILNQQSNISNHRMSLLIRPILLTLFLFNTPVFGQSVSCPSIVFTIEESAPCCYRMALNNNSECTPQLTILLDIGQFTSYIADVGSGFTVSFISPTELQLTHSSGIIPYGISTPLEFCIEPGTTPIFTVLYEFGCGLGESCSYEEALAGCSSQDTCLANFAYVFNDDCGLLGFINLSSGPEPLTYQWNFDDPGSGAANTSTLQDPSHDFEPCIDYFVCLTVTGGDGCTNTTCGYVSIAEFQPPVITCPPGILIDCSNDTAPSFTGTATAADNCDPEVDISYEDVEEGFFPCDYSIMRVWTATDNCGNTATCVQIIGIVDNIAPAIVNCPANVTVEGVIGGNGNCATNVTIISPTTTDNCDPTVVLTNNFTQTGNASGLYPVGTTTVTWTATDECDNSASCLFNVVVSCPCDCTNNLALNPGFSNGAVFGTMGFGGLTNNWEQGYSLPPEVYTVSNCDSVSVLLHAATNWGSSIFQQGLSFLAGHHYRISLSARKWISNPSNSNVSLGFSASNSPVPPTFDPFNCLTCENIGSTPQISTLSWLSFTLPIWTPTKFSDVFSIRAYSATANITAALIDNICIEEVFYHCCDDQEAFVENADNAINSYVDNANWEGVVEIGNLMECNSIDYIDWGDGSEITNGPLLGNTSLRHEYEDSGNYHIKYRVREFDLLDSFQVSCLSHVFSDSIVILPDSCFCGGFSNMYIRSVNAPPGTVVHCGEAPVQVNCPSSNESLQFTGKFKCKNDVCSDSSLIEWKLIRLPNNIVATGSMSASPFFGLSILPLWYAVPGTYEIQLISACGTESCTCSIQFIVDCPTACICAAQDFEEDLNRGFSTTLYENDCEVCFSSILLTDCDLIEWFIDGVSLGSSIGDIMFFHHFTADGTYAVKMSVTRISADGTVCQTGTFTQDVIIACGNSVDCQNSAFNNPDFNLGAVAGGINSGGESQGWGSISGEPMVVEGEMGSTDAWSIELDGNFDSSSILTTVDPVCLDKTSGNATLRFKIKQEGVKNALVLKLYRLDAFDADDCNPETCYAIEDKKKEILDKNQWMELTFPYDLSDWAISDGCKDVPSVRVRPALYFYNHLSDDQGGINTKTIIAVDNFCLGGMLVDLDDIQVQKSIHLHPNPTPGSFTLTLHTPAEPGMSIRIASLTGKTLVKKEAETGTQQQLLEAGNLPAGMYFVQLWNAGRLVGVEKLVKQ